MWPILASLLTFLSLVAVGQAGLEIVPGATWTASNTGCHIQAHGSGIIYVDGVYYMIGEDKTDGAPFQNINCYSSTNLVQWTFRNALLSMTADGDLGPNRVVERPKVLYNDRTKTYVMYMHIDDSRYAEAKVGIATSASVCGDYDYLGSFRPLGFQSRDIGLFQDDDGAAYLLTEDRPNGLRIDALSDNYLNVTKAVYLWADHIEAPAILKKGGFYFMFGSNLTGWNANDNLYSYAKSLAGPWSPWTTFADVGSNTYDSQTNYILAIGDWAIYMGDRWQPSNLMRSTYVWLPLNISGTSVRLPNKQSWVLDLQRKRWFDAPSASMNEAELATLTNGSRVVNCTGCSQGKAAGWVGGPDNGTVSFYKLYSTYDAAGTTLTITYANGDSSQRQSMVMTNGYGQTIAFLPTGDGNTVGKSVVHCHLKSGSHNSVVIDSFGTGYGPDIDLLAVPTG